MTLKSDIDIDTLVEGTICQLHLKDSLALPIIDVISLTQQLKAFPLGRTMLRESGLSSDSTDYVCHHEVSPTGNSLETWLLSESPRLRAARERFYVTKRILQSQLRANMILGVLPCGVITKIAELDYSGLRDITVIGYDRDVQGLVKAEQKMKPVIDQYGLNVILLKKNIWKLDDVAQHDLILSNRLTVLEEDSLKVVSLWKKIHQALKPGGRFMFSFFTPSPIPASVHQSPWEAVDPNAILMEYSIFNDILGFQPACRTEEEVLDLLEQSGFKSVTVEYDRHKVYPTVLAEKIDN